jgi:hypothetical protein
VRYGGGAPAVIDRRGLTFAEQWREWGREVFQLETLAPARCGLGLLLVAAEPLARSLLVHPNRNIITANARTCVVASGLIVAATVAILPVARSR